MCVCLGVYVSCSLCLCVCVCVCVCVSLCVCVSPEGGRADDIQQAAEQLNSRWEEFCLLLAERLSWLNYQSKV